MLGCPPNRRAATTEIPPPAAHLQPRQCFDLTGIGTRSSGKAWGSKFKSTLLRRALGGQSSSLCEICRDPLKKRCLGAHVSECGPKLTSDTCGTSNKRNNISTAGAARVLACMWAQLARNYSVCLAPARAQRFQILTDVAES